MTAFTFFGCAFTAYGTPFALFLFTISNDPVKVEGQQKCQMALHCTAPVSGR
jgi:hypothetical protein